MEYAYGLVVFSMDLVLVIIRNSFPPGQNGRHFADDIIMCIFVNEKFYSFIKISLKILSKGPIDNSIGLDNGLAPNRRRAIIWDNVDPIHWRTRGR